jgi:hypothetical protein
MQPAQQPREPRPQATRSAAEFGSRIFEVRAHQRFCFVASSPVSLTHLNTQLTMLFRRLVVTFPSLQGEDIAAENRTSENGAYRICAWNARCPHRKDAKRRQIFVAARPRRIKSINFG